MEEEHVSHVPQPASAQWLGTAAFAKAAGISTRTAQWVLAGAVDGHLWRGRELVVRAVPSRGGSRGAALQVLAASLIDALPATSTASPVLGTPDPATARALDVAARRYAIIHSALRHPPRSAERARAVKTAAQVMRDHPGGRRGRVSERQIYDWLGRYEAEGHAGLSPKPRADRGASRCIITRAWDRAVPFDDATKARVAADLKRYVRSLWAASTELGWKWIARLAGERLAELTTEAGFTPGAAQLKRICKLSHRFVARERQYRAVGIRDHDAKQWHDEDRGRIRRTRVGRSPMELVIGDVHPMDVLLPRPDGSTFTAKLIAFQDWATNRVFVHPVFLDKGKGVRQEHVIAAVVAMTQDPRWGVPQVLYLDNGKEYACVELVADALKLTTQVRSFTDEGGVDLLERGRAIVKAQPYNAPAKAVEGLFAVLERGVFSMLPGWVGGNRMAKKTANVGQAPTPYPHGEDAFLADLHNAIEAYETHPQDGDLDGRSPRDVFNAACDAGWRIVKVERGALLARFARDDSRRVRQGAFSYKGKPYTHRKIQELPAGTALHLRIPLWGDLEAIPVMHDDGTLLCVATVDRPYDALDSEGARESAARHATACKGIARLRANVDPIDLRRVLADTAARAEPAVLPESVGTIQASEGIEATGRELERTPAERRADEDEAYRKSRSEQSKALEWLHEKVCATG